MHVDTVEKHLQKTCIAHETAHAALQHGLAELTQNENENATLRRGLELKMSDKGELVRRSEVEGGRFREMHDLLVRVEANESDTTNNLTYENRRKEDLRLLNAGLCSQNYEARRELEALQSHCNMLRG